MSKSAAFQIAWPNRSPTFFFFVITMRYMPEKTERAGLSITQNAE